VATIEREIDRERHGRVPVRTDPFEFTVESWVAGAMGLFFAPGLALGLIAFGWRRQVQAPAVSAAQRRAAVARVEHLPARIWLYFVGAVVLSIFVHEVGHCMVAWLYGCPAVPTPAKEYLLQPLSPAGQNPVALGGVLGSIAAVLAAGCWFVRKPDAIRSALLAGSVTLPGCYALRFGLMGRGHDGDEFQRAQAALGFNFSGHAADWLFLALVVLAATTWFWRARPHLTPRLAARFLAGSVLGAVVVVLLQVGNNALFDPLFPQR